MQTKLFEVVDGATRLSVLAVRLEGGTPKENWLLERVGLGEGSAYKVQMTDLELNKTHRDPFKWRSDSRTTFEAHLYIQKNWDNLKTGDLIDIRVIVGESDFPVSSKFKE